MNLSLLAFVEAVAATGSQFFSKRAMNCLGDTIENYILHQPKLVNTPTGPTLAYELARKSPVQYGATSSAWFRASDLRRVFPFA